MMAANCNSVDMALEITKNDKASKVVSQGICNNCHPYNELEFCVVANSANTFPK